MHYGFTPENDKLRQEVRDFIRENKPPRSGGVEMEEGMAASQEVRARNSEFRQKVRDRGWLAMSWPKEYGGQDANRMDQFIVEEEFVRARVGVGVSNEQGAAIMTAGTEEQKAYFLPRMLSGEINFALGYTEPSGGSDLASLKTRADEDGDFYVINGQKMFTTGAHNSSHIYLMTRTDQDMPKHRGISIFLVPMDTPGISYTPLWTLPGGRTNMTFFDNVRVHRSAMLGEKNRGWYIAAAALNLGRGGAGRYYEYVEELEHLIQYIKNNKLGDRDLTQEPDIRDRLAELHAEAQVSRLFLWRHMSFEVRGINPPYEISSQKVWGPEFWIKSSQWATQILGPYAQVTEGEQAPENGWYVRKYLGGARGTFAHGGVQVMRNQIARRGLGLPSA